MLQQTDDPAAPFDAAKGATAQSAAELWRLTALMGQFRNLRYVVLTTWALISSGCISGSLPPRPSAESGSLVLPSQRFSVYIDCEESKEGFALRCGETTKRVADLLTGSASFSAKAQPLEEADLILSVQPPIRRPHQSTPAHNPGFLLLSLAIPFWWSEPAGYRIVATYRETGNSAIIDTTRSDTYVMWGLAPLLNLGPDRAMQPHFRQRLAATH